MSEKDKEQAFNQWFGDLPDRGNDSLYRGWSRMGFGAGYQAALTHSATALAEKDAEIARLKSQLAGESMARSLDEAEIERLQRVVELHERGMTSDAKKFEAIIMLMADKLETHGEKFNAAEFDAALASTEKEIVS